MISCSHRDLLTALLGPSVEFGKASERGALMPRQGLILSRFLVLIPLGVGLLAAQSKPQASSTEPYYPPAGNGNGGHPALVDMTPELVDSAIAFAKSMESTAPRDLLAEHWASPFGREPLPEPMGPFKDRGEMTGIIVRHGYLWRSGASRSGWI